MLRYIYIIILLSYNIAIAESGLTVNYNWGVNLTDKDLNHIVTWAKQTREKKMIILRAIDAELQRETSSIKCAELKEIAKKLRAEIFELNERYIKIISVEAPEIVGRISK